MTIGGHDERREYEHVTDAKISTDRPSGTGLTSLVELAAEAIGIFKAGGPNWRGSGAAPLSWVDHAPQSRKSTAAGRRKAPSPLRAWHGIYRDSSFRSPRAQGTTANRACDVAAGRQRDRRPPRPALRLAAHLWRRDTTRGTRFALPRTRGALPPAVGAAYPLVDSRIAVER